MSFSFLKTNALNTLWKKENKSARDFKHSKTVLGFKKILQESYILKKFSVKVPTPAPATLQKIDFIFLKEFSEIF